MVYSEDTSEFLTRELSPLNIVYGEVDNDTIDKINDIKNGDDYDMFKEAIVDSRVEFLVKSQGYELEDLYDKDKVENSKFLNSFIDATNNAYSDNLELMIAVNPTNTASDLAMLVTDNLIDNNVENINLGKPMVFYGNGYSGTTTSTIELEKDIVLPKNYIMENLYFNDYIDSLIYDLGIKYYKTDLIDTNEKSLVELLGDINIDRYDDFVEDLAEKINILTNTNSNII